MGRHRKLGWVLGVTTTLATGLAKAASGSPERLGDAHQLVIDQSFLVGGAHSSWRSGGQERLHSTNVTFAPQATYFPIAHLSLGLQAHVGYGTQKGPVTAQTWTLGLLPSVGYVQPLSEHLSLWPRMGVGLGRAQQTGDGQPHPVYLSVRPNIQALLAWSPAEHFFIAAGPFASVAWAKSGEYKSTDTSVGVMTTLGGYFSP